MGATVGEEAIVSNKFVYRTENCFAETDCAIICIDKVRWRELKEKRPGDTKLAKDIVSIEDIMRKNNSIKTRWRIGITSSRRSTLLTS